MSQAHFAKLVAMYHAAPINQWFQPRLRIPEKGSAEIELAMRKEFYHSAGAAHGSIYFKALDDATFFAVQSLVPETFVLTASFNLYFLRPVTEGNLLARGRVVSRARRLYIAEGVLFDSHGKEAARGSGSFLPSGIPLTPEMGYR